MFSVTETNYIRLYVRTLTLSSSLVRLLRSETAKRDWVSRGITAMIGGEGKRCASLC
jgi:hypothetical protein